MSVLWQDCVKVTSLAFNEWMQKQRMTVSESNKQIWTTILSDVTHWTTVLSDVTHWGLRDRDAPHCCDGEKDSMC